ncbi:MAG: hypothetical protein C0502_04295 [Opitutus sp.]|nr:hypothetical protein [Opitutus sp.]
MKPAYPRYILAGLGLLAFATVSVFAEEGEAKPDKGPSKADLAKYDANKDGKLDEAELAAMKVDKDAKREAKQKERLEKYDANKDSKVDKAEREAETADKEKAKAEKQAAREAKKAEKHH